MASRKILVAEDEPLILMLSAEILRDAGFDVIEAATVDEAAALMEKRAPEVALVFSDVETPGELDGFKLVGWINENRPEIPVVLTSGRTFPPQVSVPKAFTS